MSSRILAKLTLVPKEWQWTPSTRTIARLPRVLRTFVKDRRCWDGRTRIRYTPIMRRSSTSATDRTTTAPSNWCVLKMWCSHERGTLSINWSKRTLLNATCFRGTMDTRSWIQCTSSYCPYETYIKNSKSKWWSLFKLLEECWVSELGVGLLLSRYCQSRDENFAVSVMVPRLRRSFCI
jgi:hypothetical protein